MIAHEHPRAELFHPGHTKWDYAWSVERLRPDVLAQVWLVEDADIGAFDGYELVGGALVRRNSMLVDRPALRRAFRSLDGVGWLAARSGLDFR